MQRCDEGDVGVLGERVAQRQRAVGGQLGDEPVGDRPHALVLFGRLRRGLDRSGGIGLVGDPGLRAGSGLVAAIYAVIGRRDGDFVFGPDIAAFDPQGARPVDADKGAGARNLSRVVNDRPLLEGGQRGLDLGNALIDLLRDFVRLDVSLLQLVELSPESFIGGRLLFGERTLLADQAAEIVGVAIRKVGGNFDPLPAFGADYVGLALQVLRDEPVEQGRVLQPTAVIGIEQVAQNNAARRLIALRLSHTAAFGTPPIAESAFTCAPIQSGSVSVQRASA